MFNVKFEMSVSISLSLLVRLSPSLMNVYTSCPVFITIVFFFDLGCMLVNWGRLLILGILNTEKRRRIYFQETR